MRARFEHAADSHRSDLSLFSAGEHLSIHPTSMKFESEHLEALDVNWKLIRLWV